MSIICGDSGTGKTSFLNSIYQVVQRKDIVGYKCESNRPNIRIISSTDTVELGWLHLMEHGVVLADEDIIFHKGLRWFVKKLKPHDIWFILVSRNTELRDQLKCNDDSIYEITTKGNIKTLKSISDVSDYDDMPEDDSSLPDIVNSNITYTADGYIKRDYQILNDGK